MPTLRGWLVGLGGLAVWACGRIFGAEALEQLGFGLFAIVLIALAVLTFARGDVSVAHAALPERVQAGREVEVTIWGRNNGRRAAPLVLLEDKLPPELPGRARFALSTMEPEGERKTSFTVRPARRGRYEIGPLDVSFTDPFGLARVRWRGADPIGVLAYPGIEKLSLPRESGQRRTLAASAHRHPTAHRGEEFYTLRDYVEGDDLRRVHWPSTAKRGRYMVRQEEMPSHARATLLLDDRAPSHDGRTFERAVEAAASFTDLYHRAGHSYAVLGAGEEGIASGRGSDHYNLCLDLLATIEPVRPGSEDLMLRRLGKMQRAGGEGVLVVLSGRLGAAEAAALSACTRGFKAIFSISFLSERVANGHSRMGEEAKAVSLMLERAGIKTLTMGLRDPLAPAWAALGRTGDRGRVAAGEAGGPGGAVAEGPSWEGPGHPGGPAGGPATSEGAVREGASTHGA